MVRERIGENRKIYSLRAIAQGTGGCVRRTDGISTFSKIGWKYTSISRTPWGVAEWGIGGFTKTKLMQNDVIGGENMTATKIDKRSLEVENELAIQVECDNTSEKKKTRWRNRARTLQ